jgi:crotonobetainyl-CoA:carnitine CoA-transferase CaiB-like acyl-CoA transferase
MSLLSDIRVLDLSLQLPGPFCTLMMADYGADVVKVDEPVPRMRNPFAGEKPGLSPADRYLNRGKRSLTLNLKSPEGKEIFGSLAESADVVVEGFRPGVAARLGVDYEALSARNPRLVYCSISGFGQTGPMRDVAGHDINYISYAGILSLCGAKDGPPALPAVQIGDLFGGAMMALSGVLMALLSRQATGRGRRVDVSMTDGSLAMLSLHAASYLAGGEEPRRGEMILAGRYPCYDVYRCSGGGYVSLGALEPWFWNGFVQAIGREDLAGMQYAAGEEGERVRADLRKLFGSKSREEWVRFFDGKDICFSPVLSLSEAVSHPNVKARDMVIEVGSPLGGRERQPGLPIKFPGAAAVPRRAPFLGEHDEEILKDLGCTAQKVEELRKKGVIRGE